MDFGVVGGFTTAAVGHDELDAITSALVGSFFLAGKFEALSGPAEDPLIIPKMQTDVGSLVIGVSGKIAAGKTTTARLLERKGFAYTRFSLVVDDEIASRGLTPNSALRQTVGWELHGGKGQRWMAERVLEKVGRQSMIVVDGLRFLEDHAFFVERFGPRFVHLHVIAPAELRAGRYLQKQLDGRTFETADSALVEAEIPELGKVADIVLKNDASLDQLRVIAERSLDNLIHRV
jgi:dephospho-CoA kinase